MAENTYTSDETVDIHKKPAIKSRTGRWKACSFILGHEICERIANYGVGTNLVYYLHERLKQGNAEASNSVTNWSGTCWLTPLIGAFLADAYFGRYRTIAAFSLIYILGMALFVLSASVKGLNPQCDGYSCHPTTAQTAVCFGALYLIALGSGGVKPCISSFGADQFDENDSSERKAKSSFFSWFYLSINVGQLIASSVLVWTQLNVGWSWGFGVPTVSIAIAFLLFFLASPFYRFQEPRGSPLTRILQVVVASIRKCHVEVHEDEFLLYKTADEENNITGSFKLAHTEAMRFFDKAAVRTQSDYANGIANPWKLCTVTQVEELKSLIRLLPVLASGVVFATIFSQMNTMFLTQGNFMERHIGPSFKIPSASFYIYNNLSVIVCTPFYERLIVLFVSKITGREHGFTQLQRMGFRLAISSIAMVMARVLEVIRLNWVRKNNKYDLQEIPISIFWQVPQYFLVGFAEVFISVVQLEFFYDQAPQIIKGLFSALSLATYALGNYLSTILVTIVIEITTRHGKLGWIPDNLNRGHLDYFYWLLTILSLINSLMYIWIAKRYTYRRAIVTPR
ncbi:Peptide-transporting ATPase [Bertholletia excelsa]